VAEGSERNTELPSQFSEFAPILVGTAVWALLLVIGLVIRPHLENSGRGWWIWTAAAGMVLGGFGYLYLRRRHRKLLSRESAVQSGIGSENT
jgi:hypothetical protein